MERTSIGLLAELKFGNMGAEMPTYYRNDNSDAVCQADSVNTSPGGKRLNGFLESNREALEQNEWLIVGYIPGGINATDGWAKIISSVDLRNMLSGDLFRIVTGEMQRG